MSSVEVEKKNNLKKIVDSSSKVGMGVRGSLMKNCWGDEVNIWRESFKRQSYREVDILLKAVGMRPKK